MTKERLGTTGLGHQDYRKIKILTSTLIPQVRMYLYKNTTYNTLLTLLEEKLVSVVCKATLFGLSFFQRGVVDHLSRALHQNCLQTRNVDSYIKCTSFMQALSLRGTRRQRLEKLLYSPQFSALAATNSLTSRFYCLHVVLGRPQRLIEMI